MDIHIIFSSFIIAVLMAILFNIFIKILLTHFLIIGNASMIGVISGGFGYKLVNVGEWGIRIPFFNKVSWLDISAMVEEIRVEQVISKGGTPVSMDAMVIYGIGSDSKDKEYNIIGNAIQSSLSKDRTQISKQICEILEANFRETIVTMTPEQLINDKKTFNDKILSVSKDDLESLGFRLYDVKIKDIWDDKGYLKTLTKKGVQKITSEMDVYEKQCDSEASQKEAENQRQIDVSTSNMNKTIVEKEKELEVLRREKAGKLEEAKKLAKQKIEKTEAQGHAKIESANIEVQKIVQRMGTSLPAEIKKRTEEIVAEGKAGQIKILGDAKNKILDTKLKVLAKYGQAGLIPFLINKLTVLAESYKENLKEINVEKMTIVGSKEGETAYSMAANMGPSAFLKHLKNMHEAFGIDAKKILHGDNSNEETK